MNPHVFVIHYSEIGLKGENREFFERKLVENINLKVRKLNALAKRKFGRIIVEMKDDGKADLISEKLRKTPGIRYFAPAIVCGLEIDEIKETAISLLKNMTFSTFKIAASRSNKSFPYNSMEINKIVGEAVVMELGKKVRMKEPDVTVYIEICEKEAYIYTRKIDGIGGLPVSVSGKVVALLSGGIDSPVASFLLMKRGCRVIFVHFFNETLHSRDVRRKVESIVRVLSEYQGRSRLYMVSFGDVQREIIKAVPSGYRMIIYRRFMMRIAEKIAKKEGGKALVTGDNVAQVASQTLDNLRVIYGASRIPILTPLAGFDKEETIELAKKIGTYELSIQPYPDCCSFMIAKHPETRAKLEVVREIEGRMNVEELVEKALSNTELVLVEP